MVHQPRLRAALVTLADTCRQPAALSGHRPAPSADQRQIRKVLDADNRDIFRAYWQAGTPL